MRYRPLGPGGDYTIGVPFLVNTPATVGQAVLTRLKLLKGEWFVDTSDGTPWYQSILGKHHGSNPDAFIKQRILATPGVVSIAAYSSTFDGPSRTFTISATINTVYGVTTITLPG